MHFGPSQFGRDRGAFLCRDQFVIHHGNDPETPGCFLLTKRLQDVALPQRPMTNDDEKVDKNADAPTKRRASGNIYYELL